MPLLYSVRLAVSTKCRLERSAADGSRGHVVLVQTRLVTLLHALPFTSVLPFLPSQISHGAHAPRVLPFAAVAYVESGQVRHTASLAAVQLLSVICRAARLHTVQLSHACSWLLLFAHVAPATQALHSASVVLPSHSRV